MNGDKFKPELHLKQPRFTYSARERFTKHRERIEKLRGTGNSKHLYRNDLDKACFAHDATYFDIKDLAKTTISDKILKDKVYEIARNRKYDGYQRALASMVNKFFNKKTGSGGTVNKQIPEELHKPVIRKFKRRKVYVKFKDSIWEADLAEIGSLSSKNKNVKHLCVIDVFTQYAWVKPLKDKKLKTVLNAFIEIVKESNCKLNKLWVDQGKQFCNKLMKEWLDNNNILMYSTHNEVKSVIAETFRKILKTKIYKR